MIFAAPLASALLFRIGTVLIGFGGGLFAVGTLTAAMALARDGQSGLALGAWGAVQATAAASRSRSAARMRDVRLRLGDAGLLGPALTGPSTGYGVVYHIEIALLFATLVAIGPLVRPAACEPSAAISRSSAWPSFPASPQRTEVVPWQAAQSPATSTSPRSCSTLSGSSSPA